MAALPVQGGLLDKLRADYLRRQQTARASQQVAQSSAAPRTPEGFLGQAVHRAGIGVDQYQERQAQETLTDQAAVERQQLTQQYGGAPNIENARAMAMSSDPAVSKIGFDFMKRLDEQSKLGPLAQKTKDYQEALKGPLDKKVVDSLAGVKPLARKIVKDSNDINRYVDDGSAVFPNQAGAASTSGWTPKDMRKEYDYSKYTPGSVTAAEAARDPSLLTAKAGEMKFTDKLSAARHVTAQLKPFEEVASAAEQAFSLLEGDTGPEELGAIIKYAKALDPGSVVREGEVTMQQSAAGIVAKWENLLESLNRSGSALSKEHKKGIFKGMRKLAQISQKRYGFHREHYSEMMSKNNVGQDFMPPQVMFVIPEDTQAPGYQPPLSEDVQRSMREQGIDPDDPEARRKRYEDLRRRKAVGEMTSMGGMG